MSPVIGILLMLMLTILLAGITVSAVYGGDGFSSLQKSPMASVEVECVEGGVPNAVRYDENYIYLIHRSGDPLMTDSTKIVISGEGSAYAGVVPCGTRHYGDILISYNNLMFDGKITQFASRNPALSDGIWSAGEKIVLNGEDSINGSVCSSVSVGIDGITGTSNNYGLKRDSTITIKVFDVESDTIISESECIVMQAE